MTTVLTEADNLLSGNQSQAEILNTQTTQSTQTRSKKSINARTVLWHMTFWGFVVNYMVRCNINMAIVSMVVPRVSNHKSEIRVSECFNHTPVSLVQNASLSSHIGKGSSGFRIERNILDLLNVEYNEHGFEWNEYEQSLVLGSFYWIYWVTHLPGGFFAKRYGTKLIFGWSNFLSCASSVLIPFAAYLNIDTLIYLRTFQGFLNGFSWPAMHNIISEWIPPNERSQFVSAYMGASVGLGVCYPLFGFIISILSWEWIFHFCTVSAIIWFICWQYLVYDKPSQHPRIDPDELHFITESLGSTTHNDNQDKIPWMSIMKSVPFWITVVAHWGGVWVLFTLMTQLPTYFKFIHGLDYRMSGFLSGLPNILRMLFSYVLSIILDNLLKTNKMTRTNVRKLAVFFNCIICGIFTVILAYSGCDYVMAIILVSLAMSTLGAQACGPLSSFVDLAPNFSSILFGISATVCVLTGTFSSLVVGVLTLNNQTVEQWKYVFLISAAMSLVTGIVYIIFGSSEEQTWNKSINSDLEMTPLRTGKGDGKSDENGKSEENEKSDENGKSDESGKSDENGKSDESGKSDKNEKSDNKSRRED